MDAPDRPSKLIVRAQLLAAAVSLPVMAACASTALVTADASSKAPMVMTATNGNAHTDALPGTPGCFWLGNIYGWNVLNDSELIVNAPGPQDAYLVKLFEPVIGLNVQFHEQLGFQAVEHTGQICNDTRDYLLVPHYSPNQITIVAVRKLTMPEQAALLKAAGKPVARAQRGRS